VPRAEPVLIDRRKHPRHPIEVQVTALFSEFWRLGNWNRLRGWTHNLSEDGVCFTLPCLVIPNEIVLHIDYEGIGAEFVLAFVVTREDRQAEGWRYHCRIERVLCSVDAFGCLEEESVPAEAVGVN
jgi:hypothetical protein